MSAPQELPVYGHTDIFPRKLANPSPLGLCAFALTTFLLSLINLGACDLSQPTLVIGPAFGYGGLIQLLAGMWEMALGNTFGATALSSFGGFWIGTGIILTPGGFHVQESLTANGSDAAFNSSFGLYLMAWFIFTFLLVLCTLKSSIAFFFLFFMLDMTFLLTGIAYLYADAAGPNIACLRAGGAFGILAAYNALALISEPTNSLFLVPVGRFPWSRTDQETRGPRAPAEREEGAASKEAQV